jgi:uncharacterized protein
VRRVIDPWINVDMPEWRDPDRMVSVATEYLRTGRSALERRDLNEVLDALDANGVERAVLDLNVDDPSPHTLRMVEARPDRFTLAARVDPNRPMTAMRRVRDAHRSLPIVMARVVPFIVDLPPSDRR